MNHPMPVIVIGAGIGGLSAAIRLAAAGRAVTVLEKNPRPGGKMGELSLSGDSGTYRFDTGPSVITMRPAFERLFAAAGRRMQDYLSLLPVEPLTRYFYPGGHCLDISRQLERTLDGIAAIEPRDVEGYLAYLAYAARLYRITAPVFIFDRPPSFASVGKVAPADWSKIDGLRGMQQAIASHVHSAELRQLLGRFATYVGASPYRAPATLNVIAHVELNQGVWYPQGGIYQIAAAFERLALELGVQIRCGAEVKQIEVQDGRARGVVLDSGERLAASAVLANADAAGVYEKLLPSGAVPAAAVRRLSQAEPSCSGFILFLGVRGQHPELAQHNIFFSSDYRREFDEIFGQGRPPVEPTIYAAITSKATPTDAPPGCENWFVLVNAPALGQGWDWEQEKAAYRERVLGLLAKRGFDLGGKIEIEETWTPLEIARQSAARRGALYGASSNNRWAAFRRPHNRDPYVRGLYLAGGTAHPGGGVPMVTLSGQTAANLILEDNP